MKWKLLWILLAAVLMAGVFGCKKEDVPSKRKTFTVGFDANFKPYGYMENGKYTGFDLDLAAEVARRNNWELVLKPINWDAKDAELQSGLIDCIWNGFTINGREDKYTWSAPYVDNSQVVLVKKDSAIRKFADLAGKRVVVQTDTPVQKALQQDGKRADIGKTLAKLIVAPDYNNAVMQLDSGSADAVAMDIGVAQSKMDSGNYRILDEIVISEKYGIGFKTGNTALRDQVQQTLIEMAADGSVRKINEKYRQFNIKFILDSRNQPQKKFTVGFDANFKPYGYIENGRYVGFDLDLAAEVARRNNWKLVLKPINWDAKDTELNSGLIDCIWNGFTINGREDKYTWSAPYVDNSQVVLVKNDSPIRQLADLAGKRVVVQTDTPVQKALQQDGSRADIDKTLAKLIVAPDYNNAVMQLEAGGADAVAMDIGVAQSKINSGDFRMLAETVISEKYGIGFKLGNTALRDQVQLTLGEMAKDGTVAEITAKYREFNIKFVFDSENKITTDNAVKKSMNWGIMLKDLLKGLLISVEIFILTLIFALPLGMLVALGRMSGNIVIRNIFRVYISIMRGTPLMLQLLMWFFCPYYLFNIQLSELEFCGIEYSFTAVIIGFALNYAAYFAEIYRAGINSIPRGQYEAAYALGYSEKQTFFRIILPQVVKRIVPPMTNEVITLVKDTSLAFSLSVLEMFTIAKYISSTHATMLPLAVAGVFYYIFNFIVAGGMAMIEKKLNYYR